MRLDEIAPLREAADEPLALSMLRRLDKMVKEGRVYYRANLQSPAMVLASWEEEEDGIDLKVNHPYDTKQWAAFLPMDHLERFTIRSTGQGADKVWTLEPREDLVEGLEGLEGARSRLLVSTLLKTVRNHFRHGGPVVTLLDDEVGEPLVVRGAGLKPNGDVVLHVDVKGVAVQERIYTRDQVDNGSLHFERGSGGTVVRYEERPST